MSRQSELTAFRPLRVGTASVSAAPTDGSTDPQFTMSPVNPTGDRPSGFVFFLKQPSFNPAVPPVAGFSVTVWVRDPVSNTWASSVTVLVGFNEAWVCGDIDAAELYFQIAGATSDGDVDIHFSEQ